MGSGVIVAVIVSVVVVGVVALNVLFCVTVVHEAEAEAGAEEVAGGDDDDEDFREEGRG